MRTFSLRIYWSILLICYLETLFWCAPFVEASNTPKVEVEEQFQEFLAENANIFSGLEDPSASKEHEVEEANVDDDVEPVLEEDQKSSGNNLTPMWSLAALSSSVAILGSVLRGRGAPSMLVRRVSQVVSNASQSSRGLRKFSKSAVTLSTNPQAPASTVARTTATASQPQEATKPLFGVDLPLMPNPCGQQPQKQPPSPQVKLAHDNLALMSDEELLQLLHAGKVQQHSLEKLLGNLERAVSIRRQFYSQATLPDSALEKLPYENYQYENVVGACCENVLGYVPIPVGIAGPVIVNGEEIPIPMATTEGCLVASTHRGCKAINESGGAVCAILGDGMTRAPVVKLPNVQRAAALKTWLDNPANYSNVEAAYNSTSRFARLQSIDITLGGRNVFLRFKSTTGDAMGMNMISKGVEKALDAIQTEFPDMQILSLSGNLCTDKKPSAMNWIDGRGKSVVCEAKISGHVVEKVLKSSVAEMVELNVSKNMIGSALAGSIGGFNAHASNIVTAIYLATGQDPAQNVESSNCMTIMESVNDGRDLQISVTMPSIEVGTVGGGTHLPAQSACLNMMKIHGANKEDPGSNSRKLAKAVASAVMAGELSLMAALAAGHLVRSHMQHNRKPTK